MSAAVPSKAAKAITTTTTTVIKKKTINNPHRVQVLVDFPDPTVTIKSVHPIAIPGPQRKFVAVADGDKTFHELKDVINDELHRLYAEEAPYGLCGFKNWQYSKIPERYHIRDVLGKQCDVHVTRELLSAKKLGKSTKRKVEGETSSTSSLSSPSSSTSSSSGTTVAPEATSSSTPAPKTKKAKKAKKEAATPSTEAKPKAVVKKEAVIIPAIHAPKETAEDKAFQAAYADLTEEQIMLNISAAHAQEKKKAASGIATPEASESSASPAPTTAPAILKKQKNAKKVDIVATPTPAPVPVKAAENEVKKASAIIPFPEDSKDKSEEDIMKEISAYHKAQKLKEEMNETVREAEEIKIMMEVSENHVPASVEGKKEQAKAKKEQANAKKEQAKAKKATATPAGEEPSKPTGASAAAKGKKIVNKGYQSDDSSDSALVTKGQYKGGARRKDEDVEELQKWAAQDPATLTVEQRNELRLWEKRKYNRDLATAKRRAEINSKSNDPVVAAAATLFLDSLNVRGRPSVTSESPRKKIEKYIQETSEKVKDDEDDESEEQEENSTSSSSSSTPEAEARVKVEQQSIKVEPKPVEREKLPPSMLTEDSDSEEN